MNPDGLIQTDETGCRLWQGICDVYGRPIRYELGRPVRIQHEIFAIAKGRDAVGKIKMACGHANCINADHMQDATFRTVTRTSKTPPTKQTPTLLEDYLSQLIKSEKK